MRIVSYKLKKKKDSDEWVRDPKYKEELRKQVKAMKAEGSKIAVLTEINVNWYSWLESEFQTDPDFCEWKLYHDGDGVAIMHGPEIVAAKDGPNAVLVYDAMMLADDPADNDKLNWRTIFSGQFIMREMPEHPVVHLSGLHIYAGREVQERKASVTVSQKKRIAFESMLRSFKEDPSIVAGLEQGKCMQVFMGDWNLNEPQMKAVLELVLADVQEKSWRFQARIDPHSQIVYDLQSSLLNRDWIVSFFKQGFVFPMHLVNTRHHLACYPAISLSQHRPVIVDFGAIQSAAPSSNHVLRSHFGCNPA